MDSRVALEHGRSAFAARRWKEAYDVLVAADAEAPLAPDDLERMATAAHLLGRDAAMGAIWARAHHGRLERGDVPGAARCAFWLAMGCVLRRDRAQGNGWIARATRMLDEGEVDCVERGYLLFVRGLDAALSGDPVVSRRLFADARAIGERFRDRSLVAFARHGEGRSLIALGEIGPGAALFDEVMAAIGSGEVSPVLVGDIYCSVIEACNEMLDTRRAQEWTAALQAWCEQERDTIPYRGQCLVHRSEVLTLRGEWPVAADEAERARDCLSQPPPHRAIGAALYQIAELHRLRGDFARAEEAYREASRAGRDPQPGLALLRLASGQVEAARGTIARAMDDPGHRRRRPMMLFACVDIALAEGDAAGARVAADALSALAAPGGPTLLHAMAARASGAVLLAEGDARAGLSALRRAASLWAELAAPYEGARTRALIGVACRMLGDQDSAVLEFDAARRELLALGARPDVSRIESLARPGRAASVGPLTAREVEVLRLIASGRTNRAIAGTLGIAEKTVARHVSNIFTKLGLASRAAATAYAYEHGVLERRT